VVEKQPGITDKCNFAWINAIKKNGAAFNRANCDIAERRSRLPNYRKRVIMNSPAQEKFCGKVLRREGVYENFYIGPTITPSRWYLCSKI
jgi:hypothetical protein